MWFGCRAKGARTTKKSRGFPTIISSLGYLHVFSDKELASSLKNAREILERITFTNGPTFTGILSDNRNHNECCSFFRQVSTKRRRTLLLQMLLISQSSADRTARMFQNIASERDPVVFTRGIRFAIHTWMTDIGYTRNRRNDAVLIILTNISLFCHQGWISPTEHEEVKVTSDHPDGGYRRKLWAYDTSYMCGENFRMQCY